MPVCLFGGIAFFSVHLRTIEELRTICATGNAHSRNLQNIYSNRKQILVAVFAYQGYSSLHVRLRVSFTKCLSAQIDSCYYRQGRESPWLFPTGPLKGVYYMYGKLSSLDVILKLC